MVRSIIEGVAHVEGKTAEELDLALYDYIDPDAIRMLVEHPSESWELTFDVRSHQVCVTGEGVVEIDGSPIEGLGESGKRSVGR